MNKIVLDLDDREKWILGFVLGSISMTILKYMGFNEEEAKEYGNLYAKIHKKILFNFLPFERTFSKDNWVLLDTRKWNIVRKEDE